MSETEKKVRSQVRQSTRDLLNALADEKWEEAAVAADRLRGLATRMSEMTYAEEVS